MCNRCNWGSKNELMMNYHDEQWGPLHNDHKLFEFIILESFQAGLSWQIVPNKCKNFRKAFDNFNLEVVAKYKQQKLDELVQDKSIIRNKMKIAACVNNAQHFLEVQNEFGIFDKYIWGFVANKPIQNAFKEMSDVPATTALSDRISNDLKKRGFKFIGSTVVYADMQATGLVNNHLVSCFRYGQV